MKPIAASTRAAAAAGSSLVDTDSPAADRAPKKIRRERLHHLRVQVQPPAASTACTMSSTMANVERSSCSRNRS